MTAQGRITVSRAVARDGDTPGTRITVTRTAADGAFVTDEAQRTPDTVYISRLRHGITAEIVEKVRVAPGPYQRNSRTTLVVELEDGTQALVVGLAPAQTMPLAR